MFQASLEDGTWVNALTTSKNMLEHSNRAQRPRGPPGSPVHSGSLELSSADNTGASSRRHCSSLHHSEPLGVSGPCGTFTPRTLCAAVLGTRWPITWRRWRRLEVLSSNNPPSLSTPHLLNQTRMPVGGQDPNAVNSR